MSIIAIQPSNRHLPMPIREGVVWRCGNATSDALPRQGIASVRFKMRCLYHPRDVIVSLNNQILIYSVADQFFKSP